MNWQELIVDLMNSNAVIAGIAAIAVYFMNKLYTKKPEWKKYEGSIISAIKAAEKAIPDNSANKSVARLDFALKYVLKVHNMANPSTALVSDLTNAIQVKHAELEAAGNLTPEIL